MFPEPSSTLVLSSIIILANVITVVSVLIDFLGFLFDLIFLQFCLFFAFIVRCLISILSWSHQSVHWSFCLKENQGWKNINSRGDPKNGGDVMKCYAMSKDVMWYYVVLCGVMRCDVMLCDVIWWYVMFKPAKLVHRIALLHVAVMAKVLMNRVRNQACTATRGPGKKRYINHHHLRCLWWNVRLADLKLVSCWWWLKQLLCIWDG